MELLLRTGYVNASQRTLGLSGSIAAMTDSVVAGTFTYQGIAGFQPFVSLNLNLPTGQTRLGARASRAQMDSDIVEAPSFGEGLNIGPTIGANIPFSQKWTLSVSAGHTTRHAFTTLRVNDGVATVQRQQPGGEIAGNASLTYADGGFSAAAALSAALPRTDRFDGVFQVRSGTRFNLVFDVSQQWSDAWRTKAQLAISHTRRNRVIDNALFAVFVEPFNANSTRYTASLGQSYVIGKLTLTGNLGLLHRDRNAWQPIDQQFVSAKTKFSVGGQAEVKATDSVTLSARLDRFWLGEGQQPDKVIGGVLTPGLAIPRLTHAGWSGGLSGSVRF
jgi:hypothetical protein